MARCDFCGITIPRGTGRMYVKNDGKILDLCSSKCRKNLIELKRNPLHSKWTQRSRAARKPAQ